MKRCVALMLLAIGLTGPWRVAHASQVLDVAAFMHDVDRYRGVVRIQGVVNGVSSERHLFTLIDLREYQECRSTECATLSLPVRWSGAMPRLRSTVRVRGRTRSADGKLYFAAESVSMERP